MTKKNVALFIEAVAKKKDLNEQLAKATPTVNGWNQVAKKAGFQFSDEDLYAVMQKVLDRKVAADQIVPAFIAAQSELDASQLDHVAGGTSRGGGTAVPVPVSPATLQKASQIGGGGIGAAEWGGHIKGPFASMPGGNQQQGQ